MPPPKPTKRAAQSCLSGAYRCALVSGGRPRAPHEGAQGDARFPFCVRIFCLDPYQVLGARAWGADCILIIMAAVDDEIAKTLNKAAHDLGLDVLIETHDEEELKRALALEGRLISVNNREPPALSTDVAAKVVRAPQTASIPIRAKDRRRWRAASPITPDLHNALAQGTAIEAISGRRSC